MHKIAVTTSIAGVLFILSTCSLTKIGNWREINYNWLTCIKSSSQIANRICSMLFLPELHVYITDHVISQIVTNVQAFNFSILAELLKKIFIEILVVLLDPARINVLGGELGVGAHARGRSDHVGALVHVGEEKSRADAGLRVEARAAVAMPTSPNLEVERAVHAVLLRSEDRRQVLRH